MTGASDADRLHEGIGDSEPGRSSLALVFDSAAQKARLSEGSDTVIVSS
jgi:hypothetical protein